MNIDNAITLRADRVESLARVTAFHDCALATTRPIVEQGDGDHDLAVAQDEDRGVWEAFNAPQRDRSEPGETDYRACALAQVDLKGYWLCRNRQRAQDLAAAFGDAAEVSERGGQWVVTVS